MTIKKEMSPDEMITYIRYTSKDVKTHEHLDYYLSRLKTYVDLQAHVRACTKCPLHDSCVQRVPGMGPISSQTILLGECLSQNDILTGLPYSGPSGPMLDAMLGSVGMKRSDFFITNTIKCATPKNRKPNKEEVLACTPYLMQEIDLVKPKLILCLGGTAASAVIHPDYKITKEEGQWVTKGNMQIVATLHPAYLLRLKGEDLKNAKWTVYNTLKSFKQKYDELIGGSEDVQERTDPVDG